MMDLTERREQERQRRALEAQLRQAQKMESIGRMAGGLAHDFNNILSPIIMLADLAVMEMKPDEPRQSDFEEIRSAALRARDLTQQLLAFGRKQVLSMRVLDLNQVVGESHDMLRRMIREDIEIELERAPGLASVRADPTQIQQVLMNLALNARDSMPQGGRLHIATRNVNFDEEESRALPGLEPGAHVCLCVTDTGQGIDDDTIPRIFEPFFSTKETGQGAGLGLSMVHGIVRQHGGHIEVRSARGEGSTFRVYLPAVQARAQRLSLPPTRPPVSHKGETILLAEDDSLVRRQVRRILERFGLEVIEAVDGRQALELAEAHDGPIHLLLTDVIMPRMNGKELHERLAETRPNLKAVYMSGYTDDVIADHGVLENGTYFVQKPYTVESLMQQVRAALSGHDSLPPAPLPL
jgi:nitrogen-specific signal transduction histidine kinase/ActR/RegA family two-component response regulator